MDLRSLLYYTIESFKFTIKESRKAAIPYKILQPELDLNGLVSGQFNLDRLNLTKT